MPFPLPSHGQNIIFGQVSGTVGGEDVIYPGTTPPPTTVYYGLSGLPISISNSAWSVSKYNWRSSPGSVVHFGGRKFTTPLKPLQVKLDSPIRPADFERLYNVGCTVAETVDE